MIKLFKTDKVWHLVDDEQSINVLYVYDNITDLLKDTEYLISYYNLKEEKSNEKENEA